MICFGQDKDSNPKLVVHNSFAMLQVDCENPSGETLLADQSGTSCQITGSAESYQ